MCRELIFVEAKQCIYFSKQLFGQLNKILSRFAIPSVQQTGKLKLPETNAWKTVAVEHQLLHWFCRKWIYHVCWILLLLLGCLVAGGRDLRDYWGPDELPGTCSSNRICITICEWRLEKINSVFSFNVSLMGCCFTNLSQFSKHVVLLKKI